MPATQAADAPIDSLREHESQLAKQMMVIHPPISNQTIALTGAFTPTGNAATPVTAPDATDHISLIYTTDIWRAFPASGVDEFTERIRRDYEAELARLDALLAGVR